MNLIHICKYMDILDFIPATCSKLLRQGRQKTEIFLFFKRAFWNIPQINRLDVTGDNVVVGHETASWKGSVVYM